MFKKLKDQIEINNIKNKKLNQLSKSFIFESEGVPTVENPETLLTDEEEKQVEQEFIFGSGTQKISDTLELERSEIETPKPEIISTETNL